MRLSTALATLAGCYLFAGCSTAPKPVLRPDAQAINQLKKQGLAIVADGCVYHENIVVKDYVVIEESYQAAQALQKAAAQVLANNGIAVNGWAAPFVCGSLINSRLDSPPKVAQQADDDPVSGIDLPVVRVDKLKPDTEAVATYLQLMRVAAPVIVVDADYATDYIPLYGFFIRGLTGAWTEMASANELAKQAENAKLDPKQAAFLQKRLKSRYLLVLLGAYHNESVGRKLLNKGDQLTVLGCIFLPNANDCMIGLNFKPTILAKLIDLQTQQVMWVHSGAQMDELLNSITTVSALGR